MQYIVEEDKKKAFHLFKGVKSKVNWKVWNIYVSHHHQMMWNVNHESLTWLILSSFSSSQSMTIVKFENFYCHNKSMLLHFLKFKIWCILFFLHLPPSSSSSFSLSSSSSCYNSVSTLNAILFLSSSFMPTIEGVQNGWWIH